MEEALTGVKIESLQPALQSAARWLSARQGSVIGRSVEGREEYRRDLGLLTSFMLTAVSTPVIAESMKQEDHALDNKAILDSLAAGLQNVGVFRSILIAEDEGAEVLFDQEEIECAALVIESGSLSFRVLKNRWGERNGPWPLESLRGFVSDWVRDNYEQPSPRIVATVRKRIVVDQREA